jgi:glutathione peroxidase
LLCGPGDPLAYSRSIKGMCYGPRLSGTIITENIMSDTIFDFTCKTPGGQDKSLVEYEGKVLLVVNTASKCGFTPQFTGLESLYEKYRDQGLEILGFPCNQFGKQDPGSNDEIQEFCQLNYGVSFPMFGKIEVNGSGTDPLFEHLKTEAPGALGTKKIKWNFTKFLVDSSGKVLKRYAPATKPADIEKDIKALLA